MSRTSAKGATRGEAPPLISASAASQASRSSCIVAPPSSEASSSPSGFKARRICTSAPGRSLTSCSDRPETTRSREASAKGSASSSATTRQPGCAEPAARPSRRRRRCARRRRCRGCAASHQPMVRADVGRQRKGTAGRSTAARRGRRRRVPAGSRVAPRKPRRARAGAPAARDRICGRGRRAADKEVLAAARDWALP